jgi:hypothetical protein
MTTWWRRWAERLSSSAVPIDGDPGSWRKPLDPRNGGGRKVRPGRLEAPAGTHRKLAGGGTIERSVWRDLQLPPPAA